MRKVKGWRSMVQGWRSKVRGALQGWRSKVQSHKYTGVVATFYLDRGGVMQAREQGCPNITFDLDRGGVMSCRQGSRGVQI